MFKLSGPERCKGSCLPARVQWEALAVHTERSTGNPPRGAPRPMSRCRRHSIWLMRNRVLWRKIRLSAAPALPTVINSFHSIMFSNRASEPPATGQLCSCNWIACKLTPLRSMRKPTPKQLLTGIFNVCVHLLVLFLDFSLLFPVYWPRCVPNKPDCFLAFMGCPDEQSWELLQEFL